MLYVMKEHEKVTASLPEEKKVYEEFCCVLLVMHVL